MRVRWGGWWPSNPASTAGGRLRLPSACGRKTPTPAAALCWTWDRISPTRRWRSSASRRRERRRAARERRRRASNDAFTIRLRYPGLIVTLGANNLSLPAAPRFHLRGTKGNYWKSGLDPQEAALNKVTRIDDPAWGQEPPRWGVLHVGIDGGTVSRPVPALAGDYRLYYAGIRDALLGKAPRAGHRPGRLARGAAAGMGRGKLRAAPRNCLRLEREPK